MLKITVTGKMEEAFRLILNTPQYRDSQQETHGLFQNALASAIGEGVIYNPSMTEAEQEQMITLRDAYADKFDAENIDTFDIKVEVA